MASPTDLTGSGMGTIPGVARMELMAVLAREYGREIDPNTAGGLHPLAIQWNERTNQNTMTAEDPFGAHRSFAENYRREFPDEAQRITVAVQDAQAQRNQQELRMRQMDESNLRDAFRVPGYQQALNEPTDMQRMLNDLDIGVDFARHAEDNRAMMENLRRDGQVTRRITDGNPYPQQEPLTYADLHGLDQTMQQQQSDAWAPMHQATFEEHLIDWLSEREDLAVWLDSLSKSLNMDTEDTFEIALRMAMEVAFKENEAHMAGLNKKLQDMEEGRE